MRGKQKKILVLGCTGVGKSVFIHSLKGDEDEVNSTTRNELHSVDFEWYTIELMDTPGQTINQGDRERALFDVIRSGQYIGIINVVCYGYHGIEVSDSIDLNDEEQFQNFLITNREAEIEQLKTWANFINGCNLSWIITLTSKCDLWWNDKTKVRNYYESEYLKYVSQVNNQIEHSFLEYCSLMSPFLDKYTSSTFNETRKRSVLKRFKQEFSLFLSNAPKK